MLKTDSKIVKSFINSQYRARDVIADIYTNTFVEYSEGLAFLDKEDKDISKVIETLRFMDVLDYNEYSYQLTLTENYERHLSAFSETNIADIDKKTKNIKKLIRDIKAKKEQNESFSQDSRQISNNFKNINKTIVNNVYNLNSIQVKFKGEPNLQVKKNNLNECKEELETLSKALKRLNKFMKENSVFLFTEAESEPIKHEINALKNTTKQTSADIVRILNELTRYLNQIEKEAKKIEHINRLYKLSHDGELLEKTNVEEVIKNTKIRSKKKKVKKIYYNDEDIAEILLDKYKQNKETGSSLEIIKSPYIEAIPRASSKEAVAVVTISAKMAYKKFIDQEEDLATHLSSLDIDRKKFIALFVRVISNFSAFLDISKTQTKTLKNYIVPLVTKRR